MILETCFQSGLNQEEILPENFSAFPLACIRASMDVYIDKSVPWHWHPSFELDYVAEGELLLQTPVHSHKLKKGDAVFVNSGIMHQLQSWDKKEGCIEYAHLFNVDFLSGIQGGLLEQKYLFPVLQCQELDCLVLRPDTHRRISMVKLLLDMIELNRLEPAGYEFELRALLGRFWCLFLEEAAPLLQKNTWKASADMERLKTMMQFIHTCYGEKITLEQIAASAGISPRECSRCFQRCIKISPMNYLNDYRVRMAARLLSQTGRTILSISEQCGFSSGSYFGKLFQKTMGCTPKEYRKSLQSESGPTPGSESDTSS